MPRSYGRNERVAAAVMRELADVLRNELKDPRVKNATITEVDVSPDLKNARVYISFLTDNQDEIKEAMKGLKNAKGFLRSQVAARLSLRYMPDLDLRYDSLLTESMKLDALIQKGLNKD
ncbi:MAG: 30S ribosome-binding factor RbfA [Aeromonadales bacterium]|nr:30S ribosome-binding factor RbfA [Aeromonadales bacterium]